MERLCDLALVHLAADVSVVRGQLDKRNPILKAALALLEPMSHLASISQTVANFREWTPSVGTQAVTSFSVGARAICSSAFWDAISCTEMPAMIRSEPATAFVTSSSATAEETGRRVDRALDRICSVEVLL
jgi:hypothetical protein